MENSHLYRYDRREGIQGQVHLLVERRKLLHWDKHLECRRKGTQDHTPVRIPGTYMERNERTCACLYAEGKNNTNNDTHLYAEGKEHKDDHR